MMGFLPVLCVLAWLSSPKACAATSKTRPLSSFTQVQVNLPFNVKISPASSYSLKLEASQQVVDAVTSSVSNSVLYLGTNRDFRTQQPIYATVFLPAGSLQRVSVQSPVNTVAVDSGFSVQSFSADLSGTGTLYVKYLTAKKTAVTSTGTCSTFLNGNLGDVYLKGSGTSKFYLQGQANSLGLDLSGVSNAESAITSGNLKITGNVNFPGRVSYVAGTCSLNGEGNNNNNNSNDDYDDDDDQGGNGAGNGAGYAGAVGGALPGGALPGGALPGGAFGRRLFQAGDLSGILGSSCQKVSSANIPTPDLRFTCGIDVKGTGSSGNNNNQGNGSNGSNGNAASGSGNGNSGGSGSNGSNGNTAVGGSGGSGGSNNGNSATPGTGNTGMNSGRGGIVSGSSGSPGTPGTANSGDSTSKLRGSAGRHLKQSGGNTVVGGAGGNGGNNGGGNGQDGQSVSGGGGSGKTVIGSPGANGGSNGGRDASGTSGNTTPNSGNGGVVTGNNGNGGNGGNANGGNGGSGSNGSSGNSGKGSGNGGTSGGNGLTINTIDCQSSAGRNIF